MKVPFGNNVKPSKNVDLCLYKRVGGHNTFPSTPLETPPGSGGGSMRAGGGSILCVYSAMAWPCGSRLPHGVEVDSRTAWSLEYL